MFFMGLFFSRVSAIFFLGVFWVFVVFLVFWGVFVFVFRALARKKFGFIFRDEPDKAGNLCPEELASSGVRVFLRTRSASSLLVGMNDRPAAMAGFPVFPPVGREKVNSTAPLLVIKFSGSKTKKIAI